MSQGTKLLGPIATVSLVTIRLIWYLDGTEIGTSLSPSPEKIKTITPKLSGGGDEPQDLAIRFYNHNQSHN